MRNILFLIIYFNLTNFYCQEWKQMIDFPGNARDDAASFVIDDYAYVGTGRDVGFQFCRDFYAYHLKENTWQKITDLPDVGRQYCSSFSYNGKGYIIGGIGAGNIYFDEVWEYNPTENTWNKKNNFPGGARAQAVAINVNNRIFFGTGKNQNSLYNDWWEYFPEKDEWIKKSDLPCEGIFEAVIYDFNSFIYVGLGKHEQNFNYQIWEYNTFHDYWANKHLINFGLTYSTAITVNFQTYLISGQYDNNEFMEDVWTYIPSNKQWFNVTKFPSLPLRGASVFASHDAIFVTNGLNKNYQRTNEVWKYTPTIKHNYESFSLYPFVSNNEIRLSYNFSSNSAEYHFKLYTLQGKLIHQNKLDTSYNFYQSFFTETPLPLLLVITENNKILYRNIIQSY